jgi:hypothetical protein
MEELTAKFREKRPSGSGPAAGISRRNTQMSIMSASGGGFGFYGPEEAAFGAELSSDAESSEESHPGGADWSAEQQLSSPEMPPEYWQVQRLIKYIKVLAKNPY